MCRDGGSFSPPYAILDTICCQYDFDRKIKIQSTHRNFLYHRSAKFKINIYNELLGVKTHSLAFNVRLNSGVFVWPSLLRAKALRSSSTNIMQIRKSCVPRRSGRQNSASLGSAKNDKQGRMLNFLSVNIHSKLSESRKVCKKRKSCWNALNQVLHSLSNRNFLCLAGDWLAHLLPLPARQSHSLVRSTSVSCFPPSADCCRICSF